MKALLLTLLCMSSIESGEDFTHDSPHKIERMQLNQETDERWETLQNEVQWFLEYANPKRMIELRFSSADEQEDEQQKKYLIEKWKGEYATLVQRLTQAQQAFLEFREKVSSSLASRYGDGSYASTANALTAFEMTKWYTDYLENNLFPTNWKELYQQFQEAKVRPNVQ